MEGLHPQTMAIAIAGLEPEQKEVLRSLADLSIPDYIKYFSNVKEISTVEKFYQISQKLKQEQEMDSAWLKLEKQLKEPNLTKL